jgi:hypothetical protein
MRKLTFILLLLLVPWSANSQDERYFRQIFSGELLKGPILGDNKKYSYLIPSPFYAIDLNRDGVNEQFVFVKKDSEDWVEIFQDIAGNKTKIYSYRLETKGHDSELYRIELKKLSSSASILIMHYYEGVSRYTEMQGTARIYALTIDNFDLKTITSFIGPSIFEEHRSLKGHFHLRNYQVYLDDLNLDGVKELIVKYREVSQVFMYQGKGKWKTFNN